MIAILGLTTHSDWIAKKAKLFHINYKFVVFKTNKNWSLLRLFSCHLGTMVFPETIDPGDSMAAAMENIAISDPDGPSEDKTGRGQDMEVDNFGLGGCIGSSDTSGLKETLIHEGDEEFNGFQGFQEEEVQVSLRRGEILKSLVERHEIVDGKSECQVTEPPKMGTGSRTRIKVYLLEDFPTESLNSTKLPLGKIFCILIKLFKILFVGKAVMLNFFYNLLQNTHRNDHSNPHLDTHPT